MTPADLEAFQNGVEKMTRYLIENTISGTVLGVYEATTEDAALDAMARDAGYEDYLAANAASAVVWGEIAVTALTKDRFRK